MSATATFPTSLHTLATAIQSVPGPRSRQGVSHPFAGLLALVLLGLTARQIYMSHIVEWAKYHWTEIKEPLGFKSKKPPSKRYFVSSLDATMVTAERFLILSMGHWQVENRLHLVKDRWWDEDKHVLTRPGLGEIWSVLTDLALSLLWSWGQKGKSTTKKAMEVAMQPLDYLKCIGY